MILTINIGNTNITGGIFDEHKILETWKSGKSELEELEKNLSKYSKVDGVIIASVVPQITPEVKKILKKLNFPEPLFVNYKLSLPIKLSVSHPDKVGTDLIANMVAAQAFNKDSVIVLDSGTATTFCVLSKGNEFTGAIIAPGIELLAKALNENTALLPDIELIKPDVLVGKNTIECMQSGVYFGYIGLVKEIVRKLKKEYPEAKIFGTGGNLKTFISEIEDIDEVNYNLNLEGLRIIYELNK